MSMDLATIFAVVVSTATPSDSRRMAAQIGPERAPIVRELELRGKHVAEFEIEVEDTRPIHAVDDQKPLAY